MIRIAAFLTAALLATTASAQAPQQFGMVCDGTDRSHGDAAYHTEISVDLDAGLYCRDACTAPTRIQAVTPAKITFVDYEPHSPVGLLLLSVDRVSGQLRHAKFGIAEDPGELQVFATCKPAPFKPFPKTLF